MLPRSAPIGCFGNQESTPTAASGELLDASPQNTIPGGSLKSTSAAAPLATSIGLGLLVMTAMVAPLPLGSTGPLARACLETVLAAGGLIWLASRQPSRGWLIMVAALPIVGLLQLVPVWALGDGLLSHGIMPGWRRDGPGATTLSVNPSVTLMAALRGLLYAATLASVARTAQNPARWRLLAAGVAASGGLTWLLGLAVPARRDRERVILGFIDIAGPVEWWRTPLKEPSETAAFGAPFFANAAGKQFAIIDWAIGDGFGPYVISNHFAAGIYLTMPLLAAFWLWWSRDKLLPIIRFGTAAAVMTGAVWTVGVAAGSRAGAAALILTCLVLFWLALESKAARAIAGLATTGCVLIIAGFAVALYGQLQGATQFFPQLLRPRVESLLTDARAVATQTAWQLFRESPLFGTGLGTYGDAAARRAGTGSPWYYAHNEYAQLLAETGLLGTLVTAGFGVCLVWLFVRFYRETKPPERILGAGAWAGVAGIAAHSAFDWNLHVPANGFLTCVVIGLAIAAVPPWPARAAAESPQLRILNLAMRWGLCVAVIVAQPMLARDCASDRVCRQLREAITAARLSARDPLVAQAWPSLKTAHAAGERMAAWDPANAKLAQLIGQTALLLADRKQPIHDADRWIRDAITWFNRARTSSAVCTGLPEPIAVVPSP